MSKLLKLFLIVILFGFRDDESQYYHVFSRDYALVESDLRELTAGYVDSEEELDISFFFAVDNENKCDIYYIDFLDGDSAWGNEVMNYFQTLKVDLDKNPLLHEYSVDTFQIGVYWQGTMLYYDIRAWDAAALERENFIYETCICYPDSLELDTINH